MFEKDAPFFILILNSTRLRFREHFIDRPPFVETTILWYDVL